MFEERVRVREGDLFPFATVVMFKEGAAKYHAWQPEYDIALTAVTMDVALALVAEKIGELLTDPEYDYLDAKGSGDRVFYVPSMLSPEEIGRFPKELAEMMSENFGISAPVGVEQYYFACVQPRGVKVKKI